MLYIVTIICYVDVGLAISVQFTFVYPSNEVFGYGNYHVPDGWVIGSFTHYITMPYVFEKVYRSIFLCWKYPEKMGS